MIEIIIGAVCLFVGIIIGVGLNILGSVNRDIQYKKTIAYKNDLIDKLTEAKNS